MRRALTAIGLGLAALVLMAGPAAGAEWRFETLDGAGGPNGRTTNDVGTHDAVTLYLGAPHVWSYDSTGGDLRHAWWNPTSAAWGFETLDGNGGPNGRTTNDVGFFNTVTLYEGAPHVWYLDGSGNDLRHAWWSPASAAWAFETLDGNGGPNGRTTNDVGGYNAVAVDQGAPHVWYHDDTGGDQRHAWWNPTSAAWGFETLDGQGGPNGRTTGVVGFYNAVTLYQGAPHVWYLDASGDLRHAWWNPASAAWSFETLDGNGGGDGRTTNFVGFFNAVTLYQGAPHLWYLDASGNDLRHAWWNPASAAWGFETLDGDGGPNGRTTGVVGYFNAVTLYQGAPHVWYKDNTDGDLRHAWWNPAAAAWSFETLDGQGGPNGRTTNDVGSDNAVTLYQGAPHVWHYDATGGDLRHAWYG